MKAFYIERIIARILIVLLAVVLAAVVVFFIFWTPFDYARLARPIPAGAVAIGSFHQPDVKLENLATNVFFKNLLDDHDSPFAGFSKGNRLIARLACSRTILAYVPGLGQTSSPALVAASWLGGWAVAYRWALWLKPPQDIMALGEHHGRRIWAYQKPLLISGAPFFLSFAFEEGILIGCVSRDRSGIAALLKIYDGGSDSLVRAPEGRFLEKSLEIDQVWLRRDLPESRQKKDYFVTWSGKTFSNDRTAVSINIKPAIISGEHLGANKRLAEISKVLPASPAVVAAFPSGQITEGFKLWLPELWAKKINALFMSQNFRDAAGPEAQALPIMTDSEKGRAAASRPRRSDLFVFAALTGDYGGGYGRAPFRIAVPTVLAAVSGVQTNPAKAAAINLLNFINWKYRQRLNLNAAALSAGQYPIFSIESTAGGFWDSLPTEDRPAFAFYRDWLLVASNASALKKLLLHFQSGTDYADSKSDWIGPAQSRNATAFVRIEPDSGWRAIRLALTTAALAFQRDRTSQAAPLAVSLIKALRSYLENMDRPCLIWLEEGKNQTTARFELGPY